MQEPPRPPRITFGGIWPDGHRPTCRDPHGPPTYPAQSYDAATDPVAEFHRKLDAGLADAPWPARIRLHAEAHQCSAQAHPYCNLCHD